MISIIVPVYKVEKYLSACIDSILAQTYSDWELILVDDGSPDNSGNICDEYAAKDSRIRVFHKENGGVSSARNFGLDNANGEWIMFVDADDTLTPHALQFNIDYSANMQMVCTECQATHEDGTNYSSKHPLRESRVISSREKAEEILTYKTLCGPFCKMIKRELIGFTRFDENLHKGEDAQFMVKILTKSNFNVYDCGEVTYKYRILSQSLSHGNSQIQISYIQDLIYYLRSRMNDDDIISNNLSSAVSFCICHNIMEIIAEQGWKKHLSSELYRIFVENCNNYSKKYPICSKHKIIKLVGFYTKDFALTLMYMPIRIKQLIKTIIK